MLTRQGTIFHFRRIIPARLRPLIGQREFWASLGTASATLARARAGLLYAAAEEVIEMAKQAADAQAELGRLQQANIDEMEQIIALQQEAAKKQEQLNEIKGLMAEATAWKEINERLKPLKDATEKLSRVPIAIARLGGQRDEARRTVQEAIQLQASSPMPPAPPPEPPKHLFSEKIAEFLTHKSQYTAKTAMQVKGSTQLWIEIAGDRPVNEYTGQDALDFQRDLRRMPASHGKARGERPTARAAIDAADTKEKATSKPIKRLTEKTIKRHFSALSQYWIHIKRGGHVSHNIFADFEFPGTKSSKKQRDDWSEADIRKLLATAWRSRKIADSTYRWVTTIAAYSGMRLEEICRMRPQDFEAADGVDYINLQEHPDGWTPKSESGERAVPVHSRLISAGLLDLAAKRRAEGVPYIFPDLIPGGPDASRGFDFSREFGKHKTRSGIGPKTVFHSFRHNASTILRNTPAGLIREDWIDAVMGHDNGNKSQGAATYLKRIGARNLKTTTEAIEYKPGADPAELLELKESSA